MPEADPLAAYADLDLGRAARRGYPEAIYCTGKTTEQLVGIAAALRERPELTSLFTRASKEQAAALLNELPAAHYDAEARMVAWPGEPPAPTGGLVAVLAAGTSDLPVAREALLTAKYLGRPVELVVDVGVAGLHRVLGRLELLRQARVVVVAAGMDGALPSVVAGLVSAPVVALPTSVGYGASFGGVAAPLTMLNACAPGVAVVNIDNGYGAGHLAAQIAAPINADEQPISRVPAGPTSPDQPPGRPVPGEPRHAESSVPPVSDPT
jgi:pyridinium-3,5-biscarboxylic acid mononucleotide synthase